MENLLDRSTSRCWDCAWLNIFLSLCAIGSLLPAIYLDKQIFIVTGVCYFLILIETCCSLTRSFLANVMPPNELERYLVHLGSLPPHIKYWIQNYHYETRTYTDSKGRTHTRQVRVNTHFATEYYAWGDCVDKSPEPNSVDVIKNYKLTRVENGLNIQYTPDAWASFSA
jgi:TMEM151 family